MRLVVEEDGDEHAARGALLLNGHVVPGGSGPRAWSTLITIAGHAARWRIGHSIDGWLDELRKRDVPLTADAEASRAGYLEAQRRVLADYRASLVDRGTHLDLTALGAAIPPIPLEDADSRLEVFDPDESERNSRELLWALRRRGRVLLTGLPGGGKSVALAGAAAEWASREGWTTPVLVSLRPLAERQATRARPLRERLLDLAVTRSWSSEPQLLRDALAKALQDGSVILYLDGLDEAVDRSLPLTREIVELLSQIHPDTDVIVATRDSAYADAHTLLGFADLRLGSPQATSRTIVAVLRATAEARDLQNAEPWIARRREWVERAIRRDRQLSETPLLPILLTLLSADSDTDELPETRATILQRVVEDMSNDTRSSVTSHSLRCPPATKRMR